MSGFIQPKEVIALKAIDQKRVTVLAQELNISEVIARILVCRQLDTFDACKKFFRPSLADFHDPFLFTDMRRAVERICRAIAVKDKIVIYGDYDVDGVTATVLLVKVLTRLGAMVEYYLPNRLTEGYGLSAEGIDEIRQMGGALVVTVDCGITAQKAVARATELGIDCIITDHHEPHKEIPDVVAVLDPKRQGCPYPDKDLAGVGVALKLCQALAQETGSEDSLWADYLDIVSLGTAADIVPLIGENRIIVTFGFKQLTQTKNCGLNKLIAFQGIALKDLSTSDVVFLLAPCINAAGRLGDSLLGVKMLLSEDEIQAATYARELVDMNLERRTLDLQVQQQAAVWIKENTDFQNEFAIVAADAGWHAGVIGIAASKMVEQFCRPTFLFSIDENGMARGSGRSIRGLHLLDALKECAGLLESYGGHEAAAGACIRAENLPAFRVQFNEAVKKRISPEDLVPRVVVDAEVPITELTPKFYRILRQMEPFGPGNMRPTLLSHGLKNKYEPRVVGKNHLKMVVTDDNVNLDAIAFNFGDRFEEIKYARRFGLAFSLDENTWNGTTRLQMKVKGVTV